LHLAGKILVGILIDLWPRFLIADVTEITAHDRVISYGMHHVIIGAKGVTRENVVKITHCERLVFEVRIATRSDENLAQGERHSLPKLVRPPKFTPRPGRGW